MPTTKAPRMGRISGRRLREARERRGLSRQDLGERATKAMGPGTRERRITAAEIERWEERGKSPGFTPYFAVCAVLGIHHEELIVVHPDADGSRLRLLREEHFSHETVLAFADRAGIGTWDIEKIESEGIADVRLGVVLAYLMNGLGIRAGELELIGVVIHDLAEPASA